jgi:hypothetical protein
VKSQFHFAKVLDMKGVDNQGFFFAMYQNATVSNTITKRICMLPMNIFIFISWVSSLIF